MAYRLASSAPLVVALGAVALFLQGCGGSSGGHDTSRAFELVSQTFSGTFTMTPSIPGAPSPKVATVDFGLDMEAVRFHWDQHMVIEVPQANITTDTKQSAIFDAATKRYTILVNVTTKGLVATPPTAVCKYIELPKLPHPATVAKCVRDAAGMLKSTGSEDGLDKFEVRIPSVNGSVAADLYSDGSHVLKKIITTATLTGPHAMTQKIEMIDMNAKAGAPDESVFKIPAGWGTCVKTETPPVPAAADPMAVALLACMGMHDGQVVLAV